MQAAKDDVALVDLGYSPELSRNFNSLQVVALTFTSISLVPSLATMIIASLPAGGVGMTWGWAAPALLHISLGLFVSELCSAMPTSGGLYWWTYQLAPEKVKTAASFLVGYANTMGLISQLCAGNYGVANMILAIPAMSSDGVYVPTSAQAYGVLVGLTVLEGTVATIFSKHVPRLQSFCLFLNVLLVFLVCIALPIGVKNSGRSMNSGAFVFGNTTNLLDWQYGWTWILSWKSCLWTLSGFQAALNMGEDARDATRSIPRGVMLSLEMCGLIGFAISAVIMGSVRSLEGAAFTSSGQPLAQIILDNLGKKWAMGLMALMAATMTSGALMFAVAISRQMWAFSRDEALPFSKWLRKIRFGVPANAVLASSVMICVLSLLVLVNSTAAAALFSISLCSNGVGFVVTALMRLLTFNQGNFKPGPFYLGPLLSRLNTFVALLFYGFVVFVISPLPDGRNVSASTMNYTCVINPAIWILSVLYYIFRARKHYTGPRPNVDAREVEDSLVEEDHFKTATIAVDEVASFDGSSY